MSSHTQLVYAFIIASSTALAHGLLAAAFDLTPPVKSARDFGTNLCWRPLQHGAAEARETDAWHRFDAAKLTLRLRHGSHENALFLVAFADDMAGHRGGEYDGLRRRYLLVIAQKCTLCLARRQWGV